jgi:hypothetical protein
MLFFRQQSCRSLLRMTPRKLFNARQEDIKGTALLE